MISLNERAAAIVGQMMEECEVLGLDVRRLANGATVIDAGIEAPGSLEAGRLFSEACLGGLGKVGFTLRTYHSRTEGENSSYWLPAVTVNVSVPHLACMASQYAGWAVKHDGYFAMGSGPARALFAGEDIFQMLEYEDRSDKAVLMLEARELPDENVARFVAEKCKVKPDCLMLLVAPTASIVGSVQIAARSSETGLHKMTELGFDVRQVKTSLGLCPLAPVASDDLHAIGRTNDAILYGSQVFYSVQAEEEDLGALIGRIPSSDSSDYGTPFYELFQRYNGDFYQIDPMLFSPAQVEINNLASGKTFRAGRLNTAILRSSLLEE